MDLSMSLIDDDHELGRILEKTNLDEYELIDLPLEQHGTCGRSIRAFGCRKFVKAGTPRGEFSRENCVW